MGWGGGGGAQSKNKAAQLTEAAVCPRPLINKKEIQSDNSAEVMQT